MTLCVTDADANESWTVQRRTLFEVVSMLESEGAETKKEPPTPVHPSVSTLPLPPVEAQTTARSFTHELVYGLPDEPMVQLTTQSSTPASPPQRRRNVITGDVLAATAMLPAAHGRRTVPTSSAFAGIVVLAMSAVSAVVPVTVTELVSLFWRATNNSSSVERFPSMSLNQDV